MDLEILRTRGLGNSTYVLSSDGEAVVVDPPRDAWRVREILERRGWRLRTVVETHVHNDYLSGALELVASERASVVAPARGRYEFDHRPADDRDEVEVAGILLRARATPGHTPEHLAWEVHDGSSGADTTPAAVLTGGSLLVGSVGRTDLLGDDATDELTSRQLASLRALAQLPDEVALWPTHGSGSFCAAGPMHDEPTSTIGAERWTNPLFMVAQGRAPGSFEEQLIAGFMPYPAYYGEMAAMNRAGPTVLGKRPALATLTAAEVRAAIDGGARVIDGRSRREIAAGHIPGSLTIELGDTFASYVGWILPVGTPLVLVLPDRDGAADEAVDQLVRIGFDRLVGVLAGGVDAWVTAGERLSGMATVTPRELADELRADASPVVVDVRDPKEWREEGRIDDAVEMPLSSIIAGLGPSIPDGVPITVACKSGARATIAAGLLEARGHPVRLVARGGIPDVAERLATESGTKTV
ncbi:MAG TPA: MBL fold metallo-hydrolase [Candidatus Limnocylindrales bacterium]|nr:MBL fold metallo-hydrolase [Candidatus Limnocylindrales bacterium]